MSAPKEDYAALRSDILSVLNQPSVQPSHRPRVRLARPLKLTTLFFMDSDYDDGSAGPVLVRLAVSGPS